MPGMNQRFFGAWKLVSFVTTASDGTRSYPMGENPVGIIIWDRSGAFSAQLGTQDHADNANYVAYFGMLEAPDGETGTLVHHVTGASAPSRLMQDQLRGFRFLGETTLELRPPAAANGAQGVVTWERLPAQG
jgi:hypothetical protein